MGTLVVTGGKGQSRVRYEFLLVAAGDEGLFDRDPGTNFPRINILLNSGQRGG